MKKCTPDSSAHLKKGQMKKPGDGDLSLLLQTLHP